MSFTCYIRLSQCDPGQITSPIFYTAVCQYEIVNTTTNTFVVPQTSGDGIQVTGQLNVTLTPPIASQNAVFAALETAVQAAETPTPGLSFIFLGA